MNHCSFAVVYKDFDLQDFIDNPSFAKIDACHKDDLLCTEVHFNIPVLKHGVKKEIKNKVLERLVELKVFTVPVRPAQPKPEVALDDVCASSVVDNQDKRPHYTPLGDVVGHKAPPATLPCFKPLSSELRGFTVDAKLKVHLAHLQV